MEYFDIVDEFGNPTGKTIERTEAHRVGARHRTAHVWIFRKKEGNLQILLQKRCQEKDSFPGCYDISSAGHIPAGKDYVESAIRELKEELGLTVLPEELHYVGMQSFFQKGDFHGEDFLDNQVFAVYMLWKDLEENEFALQTEEIESLKWMDFEDCMDGVKNHRFPHCIFVEELELLKEHLV